MPKPSPLTREQQIQIARDRLRGKSWSWLSNTYRVAIPTCRKWANRFAEIASRESSALPEGERATVEPGSAVAQFAALGPPPKDALERMGWMSELISLSAVQAATDVALTEKERRNELRACAREMARMVPLNRIARAEALIRGDAAALRGAGNEELSDASPVDRRIIRGANQRGRASGGGKVH